MQQLSTLTPLFCGVVAGQSELSLAPCLMPAGGGGGRPGLRGRKWMSSGTWTSLTLRALFYVPPGQCQHLEELSESERLELWEQHLELKKKVKVSLYYSQRVCLYYILQVCGAPKRHREVCPLTALWISKENKHHCNNCKYYIIIPFWILWVHVLLKTRVPRGLH